MFRRILASAAFVVAVCSVLPASAGAAESLKAGRRDQFGPSAEGDGWFGWSQYDRPLYTAKAEPMPLGGGGIQNLRKRTGSQTFFGDFDPTSDRAIFQDALGSSSNIYLKNLVTGRTSRPPDGVNTEDWEWAPEMSTNFILFGRNRFTRGSSPWKVILYDRLAQTFTTLDQVENRCGCIWPEDVNERYVAWTKCVRRCNVWVFDTQDESLQKVPNPERQQYAAAVSEEGRVYFVRSGNRCGSTTTIRAWEAEVGGPATVVEYSYPSGTNLAWALDVVDGADGAHDLYFDQASCSDQSFRGDIYRLVDAHQELRPIFRGPAGAVGAAGGGDAAGTWRGPERPGARPLG